MCVLMTMADTGVTMGASWRDAAVLTACSVLTVRPPSSARMSHENTSLTVPKTVSAASIVVTVTLSVVHHGQGSTSMQYIIMVKPVVTIAGRGTSTSTALLVVPSTSTALVVPLLAFLVFLGAFWVFLKSAVLEQKALKLATTKTSVALVLVLVPTRVGTSAPVLLLCAC